MDVTRKLIDRSAWHHADGWRLYGVSPVRSNTIGRTRPDVSAMEHPCVKGARTRKRGADRAFRGVAKRLKGYVHGELNTCAPAVANASGRTLVDKVRPVA
ncbi:hypothetical protein GCM10010353_04090 [Streptomyces chryseus]|uniref:Transposase n=1 Tax=Streptomyces chryseus TaxID=68186 RepID=A0ABQ3DG77_9ACTN|nr:hypothetical protein GCM10010353_04090 [Streptomyces chryseus]GHA89194.1 hypothetical protein GCM10010346_09460 [Streptomyces chryseus]